MIEFMKGFSMNKKIARKNNGFSRKDSGFTLIEIAIVLVISSLLIIPALRIFDQWLDQSRTATNQKRIDAIQQSLTNFMGRYGRMPCPSSFIGQPADATYGREAAPLCANPDGSIYKPDGKGTFAATGRSAPGNINSDIIIGAVPVRDLGLPDVMRSDAYGHLFTYAVSAAETKMLSDGPGVIDVVDASAHTVLPYLTDPTDPKKTISGTAVYVLVNHGKDGKGAYPANPGPSITAPPMPCASKPGLDVLNCSFETNPATPFAFRSALYSNNPGLNWFDDTVVFYTVLSPIPTAVAPTTIIIPVPVTAPTAQPAASPAPTQQNVQPSPQNAQPTQQQLDNMMQQQMQNLMQNSQDIKDLQQQINQQQPNQ
jgi:prepilin-type N-terminal cleavage/methylation domain-containing protein